MGLSIPSSPKLESHDNLVPSVTATGDSEDREQREGHHSDNPKKGQASSSSASSRQWKPKLGGGFARSHAEMSTRKTMMALDSATAGWARGTLENCKSE